MRMHTDYCQKYMIFRPIFVCITARYCPEPFILVRSKKKLRTEHFDSVRVRTFGY